jgi:hypothetical protein
MAIEYYDYEKQEQLHKLFLNKLNELMSRDSIIDYLDKICLKGKNNNIMDYDNEKLNKEIFPNQDEKKERERHKSVNNKETIKLSGDILEHKSITTLKKKNIVEETKKDDDKLQEKLTSLNSNLNKLQDNISFDLKNQLNIFEEKKRNKLDKIKTCRGGIIKLQKNILHRNI